MGINEKALKNRIKTVGATMHITKAMELVAASKLRKATERMQGARDFSHELEEAFSALIKRNSETDSVFLRPGSSDSTCFVVIAGDRGLAGGYNSNIFRLAESVPHGDRIILPIGKKACEHFTARGDTLLTDKYSLIGEVTLADCGDIGRLLADGFRSGAFGEVYIIHTRFRSLLSQIPSSDRLLPLTVKESETPEKGFVLYEPDSVSVFESIVPEYLGGVVYGGICESFVCENAARRMAMDAATRNATDMIDSLTLKYNRARQASITQEITEIIGGAGEN